MCVLTLSPTPVSIYTLLALAVTFFVLYWINMVILTGLSSRVLLPCYNRKAPLCLWHILKLAVRQVTTCIAGVALVMAAVVSKYPLSSSSRLLYQGFSTIRFFPLGQAPDLLGSL